MMHLVRALLFATTVALAACATNPATKEHEFVLMSEEDELALGQKAAAEVAKEMPLLPQEDPLVQYVRSVGERLAAVSDRPELVYRFFVVDDKTVNAFALPGGWIYIYRGLLVHLNSEAELAAVLGHEIGHVTARHAVKQYTRAQSYQLGLFTAAILVPGVAQVAQTGITDLVALAVLRGYGREDELQADELGIRYLSRAGYDPYAAIALMTTLKRLEELDEKEKREAGERVQRYHSVFATHPETEERIRKLASQLARARPKARKVGKEAMLSHLEGVPYADGERDGAFVRGVFIHPRLGIRLAFPSDWRVQNTPSAVVAHKRKQKAYARLEVRPLLKRQMPEEILNRLLSHKKPEILIPNEKKGEFWHAAGRFARVSMPHLSRASAIVHAFVRKDQLFLLIFWAPRDQMQQYEPEFSKIASSFDRYDPKRDGTIPRIALYRWRKGDDWRKLAERLGMPLGPFTAERLAALNGMDPDETPEEGVLVKIVR